MDKKSRELVMGKLYFKNKDYKMAEKSINEYLSMNPEDVNALKLMAQVHEHNKRFDKAFEMYERCYLAEPDRTGVLLDICRILLMNEIWLEHVDYRKWLNLAIKAFPSNSIVVNFKALLSTLAPEDQASQTKESTNILTSAREDTLAKVLEKLCLLEEKLDKIEHRLDTVTLSKEVNAPDKPVSSSTTTSPITQPQSLKPSSVPAFSLGQPFTPQPVPNVASKPATTLTQTQPILPPASTAQSPFLFRPLSLTPAQNTSSTIPTTTTPFSSQTSASPSSQTTNLFQDSINRLNIQNKPLQTSPFSGNLFAQSISKLNIPTSSSSSPFSFSSTFPSLTKQTTNNELAGDKENDGDADGDGNELVPNEELAIENTCDMNPIEIKTGEEDENIVFEHRCKLFRFKDGEYKERGLGSIKVLKHKTTSKGRLIMRREVVGLVCLNCWDLSKIERMRDTQVRFGAVDASDGEAVMNVFLVKFKTKELTDTFISHLNALFSEDSNKTSQSSPQTDATSNNTERPEIELVDPKLDQSLVDKARELQLPDLFYHKLKNQECGGCLGCETDS